MYDARWVDAVGVGPVVEGRRGVAAAVSAALVVSSWAGAQVAWAGDPVSPVSPAPVAPVDAALPVGDDGLVGLQGVETRPDWVSASVTARASGRPVEVLGQRSEFRRVFVHPSGRVQEELATGPVRFRDVKASETAGWRSIDTSLVADGAGASARAVPGSVRLGGKGAAQAVSVTDAQGEVVSLALEGVALPAPVLDGSTATYPEVLPGVDVRVEVRPAGFELVWVVKSAAGAAGLARRYGRQGVVVLPTTVSSTGGVTAAADGSVQVSSGKGRALGRWSAPVVWDAKDEKVNGRGQGRAARFAPGAAVRAGKVTKLPVGVQTDQAWLTDPARSFPVTIDPTYALASAYPVFDTFVQQGYTTDQSTSTELKLGNNGSGQVARTFLNFDAEVFKGKTITSASLSLMEFHSWSCSARSWSAYDAGLASSASRWTAQPSIGVKRASSSETVGASSACPMDRVHIDMTAQAKAWSTSSAAQVGMMLRADDETDPYGWKRFYSNDSQYRPVIGLFYDRAPGVPNPPSASNSAVVNGKLYVQSATPTWSTKVPSDADQNTVRVGIDRMATAVSGTTLDRCTSGYQTSGTTASCVLPTALADNDHGWVRTYGYDSMVSSGYGAATEFFIALSRPPVPQVSCVSPNGSWTSTVKAAESCTVSFTTPAATSNSAATSVMYSIDGSAFSSKPVTQPTATAPTSTTFALGGTAGQHSLTVKAVSPVGLQSAPVTYSFGYGAPSLSAPVAGQTTTDKVQVTAAGAPANGSTVTSQVEWRLSGTTSEAAFAAVPGSNTFTQSSTATGVSLAGLFDTSSLVGVKDGSGVGTVKERVPASVDVRVCFTYSGTGRQCTAPRTVVRVPHAFGAGFPTSQAGPGQVALWTGELNVAETDGELPSTTGALSVGRSHSSFAGDVPVEKQVFGPGWVADLDGG